MSGPGPSVRTGGNVVLHWSPNLETGSLDKSAFTERPELTRIFSNSRTGRTDWHRNQFVPLPSRPPPEKPPEQYVAPKHRRHLIYLALYRDKVDKHQAAMLAATASVPPVPSPSNAASVEVDQNLAATTGHFPEIGQLASRREALAAHTAAVKASGIGLDEHVEVKRLGKLFDEWIDLTKQDVDEVYDQLGLQHEGPQRSTGPTTSTGSTGPGLGSTARLSGRALTWRGRAGASKGPSGQSSHQGTLSTLRGEGRHGTLSSDELETLEAAANAASITMSTGSFNQGLQGFVSPRKNPERDKKLERLWTVLTNPKVRCASLKDKAGYERDRQMPTKIEGIKPLMLYKLYNGPWRLDV